MILSCSACSTRYLIDHTQLGLDGRRVRCAKCGHSWYQEPPAMAPQRVDPILAEPWPIPKGSNLPSVRKVQAGGRNFLGWATLALFVLGTVAIGLLARQQVIAAWPPIERLYMLVGLAPEAVGAGLEIRNVTSEHVFEGNSRRLVIKGEVMNVSKDVLSVPVLSGALHGSGEEAVYEWEFTATEARLLPGEAMLFETRVESPPASAETVAIRFAEHD
ncbi:MAG: MJ0042-type zinc finger domain-containing protein [Pseudomonadota bacterium]